MTFASDIASAKTANARRLPDAKCEYEPLGRGTAFVGLGEQRLHSSTAKWATASSAASRTSEGDSGDCKSQLGKVPELLRGYKRGTTNLTTRRGASSSSSLRRKTTVKTGTVKTGAYGETPGPRLASAGTGNSSASEPCAETYRFARVGCHRLKKIPALAGR
jgi:hypothetical protein